MRDRVLGCAVVGHCALQADAPSHARPQRLAGSLLPTASTPPFLLRIRSSWRPDAKHGHTPGWLAWANRRGADHRPGGRWSWERVPHGTGKLRTLPDCAPATR